MNEITSQQSTPTFLIESFPVGPLQCNCTIIADPHSKKAIVIDPGGSEEKILSTIKTHELTVTQIVHTHAHFDHILAAGKIREATGAPIALHEDDLPLWNRLEYQCSIFGVPFEPLPPPDQTIEHEQTFDTGCTHCLKALHTPGHTPGSVSFSLEAAKLLVAGDTLFRGSVGRTDLWGGSFDQIQTSIQTQLYALDEATTVITGHGQSTTIGDELRQNTFVRPL